MMRIPDLTIQYEKDGFTVPRAWNLFRYMYKGGASINIEREYETLISGELGEPITNRLELLKAIKEHCETELVRGATTKTLHGYLFCIKVFYQFMDDHQLPATQEDVVTNYLSWSEELFLQSNVDSPSIQPVTAYSYAALVSKVLGKILDIPRPEALITRTRLKYIVNSKKAVSRSAEKQNLENTFMLGSFCAELVKGLTIESIYGELPIRIPRTFGSHNTNEIILRIDQRINYKEPVESIAGTYRWCLVNYRIRAEFLIFVAQTGMNRSQALKIKRSRFYYKSLGDSWEVREYKHRRGGLVLFKAGLNN